MKKIIFIALLSLGGFSKAQLLDSTALETAYIFTSLEEALKDPLKVYRLHLVKMKMDSLPGSLLAFKNLQDLDVSKNRLTELPEFLGQLTNLQVLTVNGNDLESLPKSIGNLVHLRKLYANKNNITALPASIGELQQLRILDLWSNEITYFPDDLGKLKNLRKLDLRNILISDEIQKRLKELLPNTKIFMDPDCKCGN